MSVTVPHFRVVLPYATRFVQTEATPGAGTYHTFALNNVYDPDFTGVGLQPLGFDQYSQFYGRYRVIGLRYVITIGNITTPNAYPIMAGLYASPQSTLPASPDAWTVQPTTSARSAVVSVPGGGKDVVRFSGKIDIPASLGVTRQEYLDEADFAGTTGGGPARQAYLHVYGIGLTVAASVYFQLQLWYDTEFIQPVALSMS